MSSSSGSERSLCIEDSQGDESIKSQNNFEGGNSDDNAADIGESQEGRN